MEKYQLALPEEIKKYVNKSREIFINSDFKYRYEKERITYINAYAEALANMDKKTIHG